MLTTLNEFSSLLKSVQLVLVSNTECLSTTQTISLKVSKAVYYVTIFLFPSRRLFLFPETFTPLYLNGWNKSYKHSLFILLQKQCNFFFFLLLGKEGFKIEVVNMLGTLGTKLKEKILQNWR